MEALFTIMHRNYVIYICNIPSRHPIHRHTKVYQGESDTGVGGVGGAIFFSRFPTHTICTVYPGGGVVGMGWWGQGWMS